ncbi:MAG: glycosyltransferase family 4 protein [Lentisphaeria bacterium]|nr:glycosyltransferase family 4 protein [Lentisphaeria bacterium]
MKFLLAIYKYNPFGGLQRDTLRLIQELTGRGHEVVVFTTAWDGPEPPAGTELELIPASKLRSNHANMLRFAGAFRRRLERRDFDVSVAMSRIPGADYYFAADVCMKTYWPNLHSAFALRFNPRYAAFLRLERAVAAPPSSTRIACIAQAQMRDYAAAYGTEQDRMFLLPPGMDPACRRPPEPEAEAIRAEIRRTNLATPDDTVVLIVSNSIYNKGTDRAIAAVGALPDEWKKGIRLWLIGKLPENEIRKALHDAGLAGQTVLFGQTDGVRDFMLGADLFLHPARNESAGSALIEALAAGLPVLTTDICGFAPFVQNATGTVLESPFGHDELVKKLSEMLPRLDELKKQTLAYAMKEDFCSRARVFADVLEKGKR